MDSRLPLKSGGVPADFKPVAKRRIKKSQKNKDGEEVTPSNAGQRLSLLLSINEDNELILVPQALASPPSVS